MPSGGQRSAVASTLSLSSLSTTRPSIRPSTAQLWAGRNFSGTVVAHTQAISRFLLVNRAITPLFPDQVQVACSRDPAARAAFARQAADDWRTFLIQRGRELRPGGRLVVLTMAVDVTGSFGYQPLLEAIYAALVDMVKEGFVRSEEARRMVIPTVGRSRADLVAPFAEEGCFAGLSMLLSGKVNNDRRASFRL
jgi:SAM dependent carboxyl methyltransferase